MKNDHEGMMIRDGSDLHATETVDTDLGKSHVVVDVLAD